MPKRFVNRTGSPIQLPNQRGGKAVFKPNEGTTNPWFGRFIGPGMLTEETMDGKPVHAKSPRSAARLAARSNRKIRDSTIAVPPRIKEPPVNKRVPHTVPQELLDHGCQVHCEKASQVVEGTDYWVRFGAILYCRFCDFFTEDGVEHMKGHISTYHGLPDAEEIVDSHIESGLGAEVTAPFSDGAQGPTEIRKEDVIQPALSLGRREKAPPEAGPVPTSPPPAGYTCGVCGKTVRTQKGLKLHKKAKGH
ncbi:MAG: hypothetical protein ACE5D3_04925 [Candidatus Binatia bacterium]